MNSLFASHFAEDLLTAPISGAYDSDQQLWVGNSQPLATSSGGGDILSVTYTNSDDSDSDAS